MDKLQLLGPELLDTLRNHVRTVESFQLALNQGLGWHYILDLIFVLEEVASLPKPSIIVDAGAGNGILQFILTVQGHKVISVDFGDRPIAERISRLFPSDYLDQDITFDDIYVEHIKTAADSSTPPEGIEKPSESYLSREIERRRVPIDAHEAAYADLKKRIELECPPLITRYKADFRHMRHIPNGSIDAVVSVSAVEHNKTGKLDGIFEEFNRILRPGRKLVVTTSASDADDWYHEPSKGWCFSEDTVRKAFHVPSDIPESFSSYESVRKAYIDSKELEERMSWFYFSTWKNGMPWGIWNPQYVACAVVRTSSTTGPLSDDARSFRDHQLLYGRLASLLTRRLDVIDSRVDTVSRTLTHTVGIAKPESQPKARSEGRGGSPAWRFGESILKLRSTLKKMTESK